MKLIIEFDLDGDLDNLANFHAMAREFFTVLADLIPNRPNASFRGFVDWHGIGEHREITLLEVKPDEAFGDNVQARAMIMDAPMVKTTLSRAETISIERREVEMIR